MINNDFTNFSDRSGRAVFIQKTFKEYIEKISSILDVGCSNNELKKIVGDRVYGIDIDGSPDKKINLETENLSFFSDKSYEMIVCTEVLEHIDNLHEVLLDISRVSSKYILISLPNCPDIWKIIRIVLFSQTGKFYGLPVEKPIDRHKWFFSWKELSIFFSLFAKKNDLIIKKEFVHFNYTNSPKGFILKAFLKIFPFKIFAQSYWILLEKK